MLIIIYFYSISEITDTIILFIIHYIHRFYWYSIVIYSNLSHIYLTYTYYEKYRCMHIQIICYSLYNNDCSWTNRYGESKIELLGSWGTERTTIFVGQGSF